MADRFGIVSSQSETSCSVTGVSLLKSNPDCVISDSP